jgi:hypothetical protein
VGRCGPLLLGVRENLQAECGQDRPELPGTATRLGRRRTARDPGTRADTTACATSSHGPGADAVISVGPGCPPGPSAPAARERTVAIRHRSTSANHRAGARRPATTGDPPGTSKATVPAAVRLLLAGSLAGTARRTWH